MKGVSVVCWALAAAHAHIDILWMWVGSDEKLRN